MESNMQIFQNEINDGIADQISASASIAYASVAEPYTGSNTNTLKGIKTIASIDDSDLYYVQSILVSSSWNKNDDIFDKAEIWLAKDTPEDKPTNLEHDENIIIGHITSNWPIDDNGQILDNETTLASLPNKYHILTGSVIYRGFSNTALKERAEKLIAEIEAGTKYVSMECFFKGFDYGLTNKMTGSYEILTRDEKTSYLTKFLRSYGGAGEHENYKVGRVLRNITFSGKGFVDKPANLDSIIFTKNLIDSKKTNLEIEKNNDFNKSGVFISQSSTQSENNTMSLENDIAEIKAKLEANVNIDELQAANIQLKNDIAALSQNESGAKAELEKTISDLKDSLTQKDNEIQTKDQTIAQKIQELDAANEVIAAYKSKEEEMMKKEKKMKRVAQLLEKGVDNETAMSTTDKFESIDDEAFEAVVLLAGKMPPFLKEKMEEKMEEDKKSKKKASEEIVDPEVLDNVEVTEEVNLGIGGEVESEVDSTRAALVEFVRSRLSKSTK
jgi:hypothetical protein